MSALIDKASLQWEMFRWSPPGQRFQRVYERRWLNRGVDGESLRDRWVIGGAVLGITGVLLLSGWGLLLLATGMVLICRESAAVALWLDRADVRRVEVKRAMVFQWRRSGRRRRRVLGMAATAMLLCGVALLLRL